MQELHLRRAARPDRVRGRRGAHRGWPTRSTGSARSRVLLRGLAARRGACPRAGRAAGRSRVAATFTEVREHVPIATAEAARAAAAAVGRRRACSAIGGGSTTGAAKAVALTARLPMVAVPTTYAGSEVTPVWGLTEDGRKTTGIDPAVLPRVVVYDPELTASLPAGAGRRQRAQRDGARGGGVLGAAAQPGEHRRRRGRRSPRLAAGLRTGRPRRELLCGAWLGRSGVRGGRVRAAPQALPRARRHLRPAARPHARHRAAARARVQRAGRPRRGGAGRASAGRRRPGAPGCGRWPTSWACPRGLRELGLREDADRRGRRADRAGGTGGQPRAGRRTGRCGGLCAPRGVGRTRDPAGPGAGGDRRGRRQLRRDEGRPAPRDRAEPDAAPARVRPRRPADPGGVGGRDRVPDPGRAHHRRPAPGVHPALRRARAVDADRRDQRPRLAGGHRVDRVRAVLRRRRPGGAARRRHRARCQGHAVLGHRHRPLDGRDAARRCPDRRVGGRRGRPLRRAVRGRPDGRARVAPLGDGRGVPVLVGAPVALPDPGPTARSATCSPPPGAARCARRTCTSRSTRPATAP